MKNDVFISIVKVNPREEVYITPANWHQALSSLNSSILGQDYSVEVWGELREQDVIYARTKGSMIEYNTTAILDYLNTYYRGNKEIYGGYNKSINILSFYYNLDVGLMILVDDELVKNEETKLLEMTVRELPKRDVMLVNGFDDEVLSLISGMMMRGSREVWL